IDILKKSSLGFLFSVLTAFLTATSSEAWEQSVISEVYGLHIFFTGIILLLTTLWLSETGNNERSRYFFLLSFVLGLSLSNHTTTLVLLPPLVMLAFITDRNFILNLKRIIIATGFITLGLSCFIYLPLASARNPMMDWGNPETWTNFWRVIARHQYQLNETQTLVKFISQLKTYFSLLGEQWFSPILVLVLPALVFLWKRHRSLLLFVLVFWFFTAPVTTYLTNFDVTTGNPLVSAENKALVSVFYIPSYMIVAALVALGTISLVEQWPSRVTYIAAGLLAIACLWHLPENYKRNNMHQYRFTECFAENIFSVTDSNALVIGNWDPLVFPFFYYQQVEKRRPDLFMIDQELLRRSWYIQMLRDHNPESTELIKKEIDDFLDAVKPFEAGEKFDGNYIQRRYERMINALIDNWMQSGRSVYLTYDPPKGIAEKYYKESVLTAIRLRTDMIRPTSLDHKNIQTEIFTDEAINKDRMARFFVTYYGRLFYARAAIMESLNQKENALTLYERAAQLLKNQSSYTPTLENAIRRLQAKAATP
ncbi:MAG TPA: DUF2723 domain-containing protein, partial [bacterium]|nr:DUF2723 domain-containing protein [bacterium]